MASKTPLRRPAAGNNGPLTPSGSAFAVRHPAVTKPHTLCRVAHRAHMDASDLRLWLIEMEGLPSKVAEQMGAEYEYGRELLAFANGRRRSA